jgi:hypothetical protein
MDPLVGQVLDSRYRIDREVGAGGFGVVYAAWHLLLQRRVALKVLRLAPETPPAKRSILIAHFLEEGRTLTRLRHDYIVSALDLGSTVVDGLAAPYLALEWCDGDTLEQLIAERRGRRFTLTETMTIFEPLVEAVAHAHALGIAHRDIKPANVMITRAAGGVIVPRLIDFGIAKLFEPDDAAGTGSTHTVSGSSPFTPAYAAPEQIAGARTGPWTDVHALGLLFVELATGHHPYGYDAGLRLRAIDPLRPTPQRFGVDVGALERVIARALALRPAERYADAQGLRMALGQASATTDVAVADTMLAGHPLGVVEGRAQVATNAGFTTATTQRTEHRPGAAGKVLLATFAGVVVLAILGLGIVLRYAPAAWSDVWVPASRPPASVAPPAPAQASGGNPCHWERAFLEKRFQAIGVANLGVMHQGRTIGYSIRGNAHGAGAARTFSLQLVNFANETDPAAQVRDQLASYALPAMRNLPGQAFVYGASGSCVAVLGGPPEGIAALYDKLFEGALWDTRGSTLSAAPDLGDAGPSVPGLSSVSAADIEGRLKARGDSIKVTTTAYGLEATVTRENATGYVSFFAKGGKAALEEQRKTRRRPFVFAKDGDALFVCHGDPPFEGAGYLFEVLEGLSIEMDMVH